MNPLENRVSNPLLIFGFLIGIALASFAVGVGFVSGWYSPERQGFALGVYGAGNIGQSLAAFGRHSFASAGAYDSTGNPSTTSNSEPHVPDYGLPASSQLPICWHRGFLAEFSAITRSPFSSNRSTVVSSDH